MKTAHFVHTCLFALSLTGAAMSPAVAADAHVARAVQQGNRTIGEEAAAIVARLERGLGGLNDGQRNSLRQAAESYARDRRASQQNGDATLMNAATVQFDRVAEAALSPSQNQVYLANKPFFLSGQGNNPAQGQPRTSNTVVAGIVNRFEQGLNGLNDGQREAIRQLAESYVRDRDTLPTDAITQFENGLQQALRPDQFSAYQSRKQYYLNGGGQRGGGRRR